MLRGGLPARVGSIRELSRHIALHRDVDDVIGREIASMLERVRASRSELRVEDLISSRAQPRAIVATLGSPPGSRLDRHLGRRAP